MSLRKTTLIINGAERMFLCDPEEDTLAIVLRKIGLTGTKIGCGTGQCGACSVILDGKVVRSCVRKMKTVKDYSTVQTIEGIGSADNLHPLQLAWIVHGGVQCGFCTPGFIVSAKALLDENTSPTRDEVREWFRKNRNACRCTGYKPLVDAVMAAAKVLRGEMTMDELSYKIPEDGKIYNSHYPRPAALAKVLGTCDYGDDIAEKNPEMLKLAVVLGRVSHANIISIDTAAAAAAPGVVRVLTHKDVQGINRITNPVGHARAKSDGFERPLLMDEKIFRYGDAVAIVCADTVKHARDAAKLVKVEYEQLPEYMNALDAMAEDAIEVHPGSPNIFVEAPVFKGQDTREVWDDCDTIVEGSFYSSRQPHLVIEPDVAQAYIDDDDYLVVHCKSLTLHVIINNLHRGLGWPMEKIRVIENPTGASFGYAMTPATAALVAIATIATKQPVSLTLSYEEYMHFTGKRAPSFSNGKIGCDAEGNLKALEFEMAFEKGPYAETSGTLITKGLRFFGAPYFVPNVMGLCKAVFTNHNFSTAYRGFGSPQVYTGSEQLIDMLAGKIGMDPFDFRYKNILREGQDSNIGNKFDVYPMQGIMDAMRPKYEAALARAKRESTPEKLRGVGIACGQYNTSSSANDQAEIALELNPDGSVTNFNTWEDQGQGADIGTLVHTHEALRPLGLTPDQIKLVMNDTLLCPKTGPAAGSRSHYMAGNAIIDGANKLMDAMRKPDGTFRTYDEMVAEGIPTKYIGVFNTSGYTKNMDANSGEGYPSPEYTYGMFLADVEVEAATGKTRVISMHCVADIGTIGNYLVVDGQAYGGMMHSIGFALKEEYEDIAKNISLIGAGFPFIDDIPDGEDFTVEYVETERPTGPQGSSGCAELFQSAGHTAVLNAINAAIGARIYAIPATPDKVKAALDAAKAGTPLVQQKYYLGEDFYETLDEMKANPV